MTKALLLLMLGGALLSGCVSYEYPYSEAAEARLLRQVAGDVALPTDLRTNVPTLVLTGEVKAALSERISSRWGDRRKLDALREYLFGEDERNIQYSADDTKTAMGVWETGSGNCLSMTNLFIAAARYIGLDANYQTVEVRPTWDNQGATMIRYEHIITVGDLRGGQEYVIDFLPEFVIGERQSKRITDSDALALYYNNLGAEAVIEGDPVRAIEELRRAITLNPLDSDAWNNMGAALRRSDNMALAEFSYQRAMKLDRNNYSALSNLAQFYQYVGRDREADAFVARVARYRARNPWFHFFLARFFFERGQFGEVITLLERSIVLKRDEPDFYDALARTYEQMGNLKRQEHYLALADKYRNRRLTPAPRQRGHRFWIYTIGIN